MASNKDDLPKVTLSALKFANWQSLSNLNSLEDGSKPKPTGYIGNLYTSQSQSDFRRPEAYERMAADIPGEELAHDATIWKLYLEEAEEYDQELVKTQHASLDMLLLFAALFSAILTAFLIESKNLLQQDPADTSAALLLMMVQSQQRIELGLPPPELIDPSPPAFVASTSARWINGMWFVSLALSLSAALIAMLGKEWLNAYLASRPRPAHSHALLRQSRLEGLEHWWALHILALLPSLLHASLLLFSIGLVIYLWTLDTIIATVIAGLVGVTSMFYIVTAVLGAVCQFCPYVTQISGYIQTVGAAYLGRRDTGEESHQTSTSLNDLRALLWLANHARDPAIVDCSYQALAGLRLSEDSAPDTNLRPNASSGRYTNDLPMQLDQQTDLQTLFSTVCGRFENLTKYPLELSAFGGINAARYANALVGMSTYLKGYYSSRRLEDGPNVSRDITNKSRGGGHRWWWKVEDAGDYASVSTYRDEDVSLATFHPREDEEIGVVMKNGKDLQPSSFAMQSLYLLEILWSDNCPAFSGDTYASLLVSDFALLGLVSDGYSSSATQTAMTTRTLDIPPNTPLNDQVIDILSPSSMVVSGHHVPNIRQRYSQSLIRTCALLQAHSRSKGLIGSLQLNRLLEAAYTAARCHALDPIISSSIVQFQSHVGSYPRIQFIIPVSAGAPYQFHPNNLNSGILGSLLAVLSMGLNISGTVLETHTAAARALSVFAPVCLYQSEGLDLNQLLLEFDFDTWSDVPAMDLEGVRYIIARQVFLILRYLGSRLMMHNDLCLGCLKLLLDYLAEADDLDTGVHLALRHRGGDIMPILEFIGANESNFSKFAEEIGARVADLSRMYVKPDLCLHETLPPHHLPIIMRLLGQDYFEPHDILGELQIMVKLMRDKDLQIRVKDIPWSQASSDYLQCFTRTDKGFSALAHIGHQERFTEVAIDVIAQVTRLAAGKDPALLVDPVELQAAAIPGFLDVVSIVIKHFPGIGQHKPVFIQFSQDALHLMTIASKDATAQKLMASNPAYIKLLADLRSAKSDDTTQALFEESRGESGEIDTKETDDRETDEEETDGQEKDCAHEETDEVRGPTEDQDSIRTKAGHGPDWM